MKPINLVEQYLKDLKLCGLQESLSARLREAQTEDLGYEEFLNLCLFDEWQNRKNTRIKRLVQNAAFQCKASLEAMDYTTPRGLDKKLLSDLSNGHFIEEGLNLLVCGPTGVGKTFLASALGNAACRSGKTTLFYRMNMLCEKLTYCRAQGTYLNFLKKLVRTELLILDDFGIKPLTAQQFQDLYDILDERFETKATIITSQLPIENWPEVISDPVTCEAITDRIVTKAIKIFMKGESYRKKRFKKLAN